MCHGPVGTNRKWPPSSIKFDHHNDDDDSDDNNYDGINDDSDDDDNDDERNYLSSSMMIMGILWVRDGELNYELMAGIS